MNGKLEDKLNIRAFLFGMLGGVSSLWKKTKKQKTVILNKRYSRYLKGKKNRP